MSSGCSHVCSAYNVLLVVESEHVNFCLGFISISTKVFRSTDIQGHAYDCMHVVCGSTELGRQEKSAI